MRIVADDLTHPDVVALLDLHVRSAHENSPAGSAFALDLDGLNAADLAVYSAWDGEVLLGIGALRALADDTGELKSMRTAPGQLRRGVAGAMLAHLTDVARTRGYARLVLETGTGAAFAPARALYERAGFVPCGAFGTYALTEFNRCYEKRL